MKALNPGGGSAYSNTVTVTTPAVAPTTCTATATAACLLGGRFKLQAMYQTPQGELALAQVVPLTADTAYLWFFSSSNVEAVVKVLDGCGLDAHYWVFAGGLTNVRVGIRVTDTRTGAVRKFDNPIGTAFVPVQDTLAIGTCGAAPASVSGAAAGEPIAAPGPFAPEPAQDAGRPLPTASATCTPTATAMCLDGGRFRVQAHWEIPSQGRSGEGTATQLTPDTGYFWFFSPTNVEAVVKVLDACGFNQRHWVFAGGLTDVGVTLTVTDTQTGATKTYVSSPGTPFQPIQDTAAFICP